MGLPAWGQATADDARRQPAVKANRLERFHRSGKRSAADRFAKIPSGDNDTSAQPQTQAMGAARREPRRGETPVTRASAVPAAALAWGSSVEYRRLSSIKKQRAAPDSEPTLAHLTFGSGPLFFF